MCQAVTVASVGSRIQDLWWGLQLLLQRFLWLVLHTCSSVQSQSAGSQGWPRPLLSCLSGCLSWNISSLILILLSQLWVLREYPGWSEWRVECKHWGVRSEDWPSPVTWPVSQSHLSQAPASTQCRRPASHYQPPPVTSLQHGLCLQHRGRGKYSDSWVSHSHRNVVQ